MATSLRSNQDVYRRNDEQNLEIFSLIWLDLNTREGRDTEQKLRSIINHLRRFKDVEQCQQFIEQSSKNDRFIIIVSGQLGRKIVPSIHSLRQVISIYIYCMDKKSNEQWSSKFSKVKGVVIEMDELISRITIDHKVVKKVEEPLSYSTFMASGGKSTSGVNGEFVFTQLLIDCLLKIKSTEVDRQELIRICEAEYQNNQIELNNLHEFRKKYSPEKVLSWYTKQSFFYKILNGSLRNQNIHMIFLFRSFIFDIYLQLQRYQAKHSLVVYRSQMMSSDELRTLKERLGQLISINSFFSTSANYNQALSFLRVSDDLERVLFEIDADPKMITTKPFADISEQSVFVGESEILFMLGSIFRLQDIHRNHHDNVWIIRMSLSNDDEHELKSVLLSMKQEIRNEQINLQTLGQILWDMGKLDLAERYFIRLLDELPSTDLSRICLYRYLGKLASQRGDYDMSMQWHQKLLESKEQNQLSDHPTVSKTKLSSSHFLTFKEFLFKKSESTSISLKSPTYKNQWLEQKINVHRNEPTLRLSGAFLTDQDMEIVSYYLLRKNTTLTKLSLIDNQIGDKGVQYISAVLQRNTTLTQLELAFNQIEDIGAQYIGEMLTVNTTLTHLTLSNNQIGIQGAQSISEALQKNTTLKELDLGNNFIGDAGVRSISEMLQKNTTLTFLSISSNQLENRGVQLISEALIKNATLIVIDLSYNKIGDNGAHYISDALQKNTKLKELRLYYNHIGDRGAQSLGEALVKNTILTHLSLSNNQIGEKGANYLIEVVLQKNKTLSSINLCDNQIRSKSKEHLRKLAKNNTNLNVYF